MSFELYSILAAAIVLCGIVSMALIYDSPYIMPRWVFGVYLNSGLLVCAIWQIATVTLAIARPELLEPITRTVFRGVALPERADEFVLTISVNGLLIVLPVMILVWSAIAALLLPWFMYRRHKYLHPKPVL